jgi:hypothetical protein
MEVVGLYPMNYFNTRWRILIVEVMSGHIVVVAMEMGSSMIHSFSL